MEMSVCCKCAELSSETPTRAVVGGTRFSHLTHLNLQFARTNSGKMCSNDCFEAFLRPQKGKRFLVSDSRLRGPEVEKRQVDQRKKARKSLRFSAEEETRRGCLCYVHRACTVPKS